jgi:non-homologous end joining protein Ku
MPYDFREHAFSEVIGNAGRQAEKFEHEYENALKELLRKKRASGSNDLRSRPAPNVVNFMDALRQSGRRDQRPGRRRVRQ